jgi:hypothetical protein
MKRPKTISWILQIVVAVILAQTFYFKFSGAQESVELFTMLGMEPHGRIITGILELLAVVLILIPHSVAYGAILSWGLMSGAILAHLTRLGFQGEAGILAALGIAAWICSAAVIFLRRDRIPLIRDMFPKGTTTTL